VHWFAGLPHFSYRIPTPSLPLTITFFVILGLLIAAVRSNSAQWRHAILATLVAGLGACALLIALFPFAPRVATGKLELSVLDVGQGDSLFIVSPHGSTLLIDGGGAFGGFPGRQEQHTGVDPGEEAVSAYLWSRGFQHLNIVALTHAHQDHLGGLTAILQNFRVDTLWIGREVQSPGLSKLEDLARARSVRIEHQTSDSTISWDGVEIDFLWPATTTSGATSAKNSDSLVLRLRYRNRSILLPGDAEKDAERSMLRQNSAEALQSDVLKIGHHGSKNSTMPEFLDAVHPRLAIISAGEDNPYGHHEPDPARTS
jgi:competence protein ComEC